MILNTTTNQELSLTTWKKRQDIEEIFGYVRGHLRAWKIDEIEYEWSKLFHNEEPESYIDDEDLEEEL